MYKICTQDQLLQRVSVCVSRHNMFLVDASQMKIKWRLSTFRFYVIIKLIFYVPWSGAHTSVYQFISSGTIQLQTPDPLHE
jgi:hypothetical protein